MDYNKILRETIAKKTAPKKVQKFIKEANIREDISGRKGITEATKAIESGKYDNHTYSSGFHEAPSQGMNRKSKMVQELKYRKSGSKGKGPWSNVEQEGIGRINGAMQDDTEYKWIRDTSEKPNAKKLVGTGAVEKVKKKAKAGKTRTKAKASDLNAEFDA